MRRFKNAIVRQPGKNFADGISDSGLGKPSFEKALEQHHTYCSALVKCGLELTVLQADERFPDGCFVEDTALVLDELAIIARPGNPARLGEEEEIAQVLADFKPIETLELPGHVDGGDVMRTENHFYIGMSHRTNEVGAKQLAAILARYGYPSSQIPVKSVLHLKTGITYLGGDRFIAIDEFYDQFGNTKLIKLENDEKYSANCLLINDYLLIPKGFPKSKKQLIELGYQIIEIEMSEFRKMDGGLTCLSLLF
jgi:dimethylargininase